MSSTCFRRTPSQYPVYPNEPTLSARLVTSVKCQFRKSRDWHPWPPDADSSIMPPIPINTERAVTGRFIAKATAITCAMLMSFSISVACATDVRILCASGMREVVSELTPRIEQTTGHRVAVSFGEAGDLRKRIQGANL